MERLRARLGMFAVQGIETVADHRPELAWRLAEKANETPVTSQTDSRPLWLLAEPHLLQTVNNTPWLHGPLRFATGPERIESGWWDAQGIARDYYVAETTEGSKLWVFRERKDPERWYLQGIFG